MIAWLLAAAFAILALSLFGLYKRALLDAFAVASLFQVALLDGEAYALQREAFTQMLQKTTAPTPALLASRMNQYLCDYAADAHSKTNMLVGLADLLWAEQRGNRHPK